MPFIVRYKVLGSYIHLEYPVQKPQIPVILHSLPAGRQALLVLAVLGEQFASGWECVHAAFPVLGDTINTVTIKDRLTDKIFH